jgi:hypothetical protein
MEHVSLGSLRDCFYVPFRNAIHMFSANPAEGIFCVETVAVYPEIGRKKDTIVRVVFFYFESFIAG